MSGRTNPKPDARPSTECKREPTEREREAIEVAKALNAARPLRVRVDGTVKDRTALLDTPYRDRSGWGATLHEALGTNEHDFAAYTLGVVMDVMDPQASGLHRYNAALALIGAIAPKDELEASLAAQMVAVHALSLDCLGRAARADRLDQRDLYINQATKLGRTFTAQFEAIHKARGGGKQQVEVRHVYIDARGGQNVIAGSVGGGGRRENGRQPHEPGDLAGLAFAPGAPMLGAHSRGDAVPGARDADEGQVPTAWREGDGCPDGQGQREVQARAPDEGIAGGEAVDSGACGAGAGHAE